MSRGSNHAGDGDHAAQWLRRVRERDVKRPGLGDVLVRAIASGTTPVDAKLRANGIWASLTPPMILSYDMSECHRAGQPWRRLLRHADRESRKRARGDLQRVVNLFDGKNGGDPH
ncbi:MAG: hypothetical protein ACRELA_03640 [Candidatus Rokuibacteriota bacterium]